MSVHDGWMRRVSTMAMASLVTVLAAGFVAATGDAAATGCAATITISGPSRGDLVLTPARLKVGVGACVAFTNSAATQVSLSVTNGGGTNVYTATLAKGTTKAYRPKVGKDTATATGKPPLNILGQPVGPKPTGTATITVSSPPSTSPTGSGSPAPGGHSSGKPVNRPTVASKPHGSKHHTPRPRATGIKLPPLPPLPTAGFTAPLPRASNPVVAPGPSSAPPVTTTSSPVAAVIGGPLEPTGDNGRGLPVAVAVLVVLGMVTGWGRVLLAAPGAGDTGAVDNHPKGQHRL
jgi:plastocyanin